MTLPHNFKLQKTAVHPGKQLGIFALACVFSISVITTCKNVIGPAPTLKNLPQEDILYYRPKEEKRDIFFFNWGPLMGESAGRPKKD